MSFMIRNRERYPVTRGASVSDLEKPSGAAAVAVNQLLSAALSDPASDARLALPLPSGPYATFKHALANRETSPVQIVTVGTSLTEGAKISALEKRWVNRLADKLRSAFPTLGAPGGIGYISADYKAAGPIADGSYQAFTRVNGTPNASHLFGLGRRSYAIDASGEHLSISVFGTSVDVLYTQGTSAGSFGVSIDGGSVQTYNRQGSTSSGKRRNVPFPTRGQHTVDISWVSGATEIEGIYVYDGDENKGIHVWEGGSGGAKSVYFTVDGATYWQGVFANIQPDLVLIELGSNDWWYNSGVVAGSYGDFPPASMKTYVQQIITSARTLSTIPPSIAIIVAHDRGDASAVEGQIPLLPWNDYVVSLRSVIGDDPSIGLIDMRNAMGPVPYTAGAASYGLLNADKVHLNDAGAEDWANSIFKAVTS